MGLDVYLCQFEKVSADAILDLSRYVDAWTVMPKAEKGSFQEVICKTRELGLAETTAKQPLFGGTHISFPSKQHPGWPVGDWYSLSSLFELVQQIVGKDINFVFPEAVNNPSYFRPDWSSSKKRLAAILGEFQKLKPAQIGEFLVPHIPEYYLEKVQSTQIASASEMFARNLAQIDVMIETLDYVLSHEHPQEFLLRWSA